MDMYRVSSTTPGKDAMGTVTVKVSREGRTFTGRGLHTNVVEASIRAYLRALNKMRNYAARKNR